MKWWESEGMLFPIMALTVALCIFLGNGCDRQAKDHAYRMEKLHFDSGYQQFTDPRTNAVLWRKACPDTIQR